MSGADVHRLEALGLLVEETALPPGRPTLRALCAAGALQGGLSVALDVRPDELVGALCQCMEARGFSVLDVRIAPPELWVAVGDSKQRWAVPDVEALVQALNHAYRKEPRVRAIARLGEVDEARQLWCVPKAALAVLLEEGLLEAENAEELQALAAEAAST